jgi:peptide/nickel transport system substrate-binding protein
MDMKRNCATAFCIAAAIFLFSSALAPLAFGTQQQVPEKEKQGGTLIIAIPFDVKSMDSRYLPGSGSESFGQQQLYERMVEYAAVGTREIVPLLAESWKQVDDKTWIVNIRKGVKFHNGKEMTGEDVWKNMDWKLNSRKYLQEKGWRRPRVPSVFDPVKSIELVDKYALKFTLKFPFAPFPNWILNWSVQGISDPAVVEKYEKQATLHPVGTGPFKFVEWISGDHLTLERFDSYWGRRAYLDRVVFRVIPDGQTRLLALQKGEVDVAIALPLTAISSLQKDPKLSFSLVEDIARIRGGVIWFNVRRWPMNSLKFRQAVIMGADWTNIAKVAFPKGSFISRKTFLKGSWAENPEAEKLSPAYNPAKAKQLIKELEKETGKPLPAIEATVENIDINSNIMQIAAKQLEKVGINFKVQVLEHNVLLDTYRRNPQCPWDIMLHNIKAAGMDPFTGVMELWSKSKAAADDKNLSGYENPKFDELVEKGVAVSDRKVRKGIYQELERIALRDLVAVPFSNIPRLIAYKKAVHDLRPHDSYFVYLHAPWNNVWVEKGSK